MRHPTCPDIGNLQSLLDDGGGGDEALDLVAHLETCADCRQTLMTLAADPDLWEDAARGLVKRVGKEPALRGVVQRLKSESLAAADDDLSFLQPPEKPGLLGMLGPYEVEEEIGRGGMGVVLKARDPGLNRVVALKVLSRHLAASATARLRFVREGRAAAAVCHEHIVTVYSVNEADGLPYLVMQYVAGESLQDRLDRAGPLDVEEIVTIGAQTASGLAAAHAHKLIHRDIKPANLLLEVRDEGRGASEKMVVHAPRVKITDFGLARMTDDVQLTQNGVLAGTPEYMAPEQGRGEVVDHRADLFSLGSVLYAMGTGASPFRGPTTLALIRQVSEETPAPMRTLNPHVTAWLEELVARLMAKDPAERFQSAAEAAAALEGYLAHLRQPATVSPPALATLPLHPSWQGDTEMLFACSSCGTKLKARAEQAGKKVKCPRCSLLVLVPATEAAVPKKARSTTAKVRLCASLGLGCAAVALVVLGVWFFRPATSFLDIPLGNRSVPGVADTGFYYDENDGEGPFRWTNGKGKLVIPLLENDRPQALLVQLDRLENCSLQITVNNREVLKEEPSPNRAIWWQKTIDLRGVLLSKEVIKEVIVEIVSNTRPDPNDNDGRKLGVTVRGIKLLSRHGDDKEEENMRSPSFLNVTLGNHIVPGIEESGFHPTERGNDGRFRWTKGIARLVIPLDKKERPHAILLQLGLPKFRSVRLTANDHALLNEMVREQGPVVEWSWEKTFDVSGIDLGNKVTLEISSNVEPLLVDPRSEKADPRELGVALRGIKLLGANK